VLVKKRGSAKTKPSKPAPVAAPPMPNRAAPVLGPEFLIPIYLLLILFGYLLFHSGRATVAGNTFSSPRSLFTAINAATLTGFSQPTNVNDYLPLGRDIVMALTIAGICFSLLAGGLALVRIARLPYSDRRLIGWTLGSIVVVFALGGLFAFAGGGLATMFQAISAFGNSGLYTGVLPSNDSIPALVLLLPLSVLGGLGLPVLMELIDRARGKATSLSLHSRTVLVWTSGVYLAAALLLLLLQLPGSDAPLPAWQRAIATASCEALNARSTGFPFEFATYWPRAVQWVTIGLMIIGASPAGSAGGIKVTTLAVLCEGTRNTLKRRPTDRLMGIALLWVGIYAACLLASLLALLISEPQMPADRLLFLASSALGNVGLSHDPVSVSDFGLNVLSATMLIGRIAPVLVLWWTVRTTPEALVAIG
jgi:trk system potassium uptake protein TrkH